MYDSVKALWITLCACWHAYFHPQKGTNVPSSRSELQERVWKIEKRMQAIRDSGVLSQYRNAARSRHGPGAWQCRQAMSEFARLETQYKLLTGQLQKQAA